MQCTHQMRDLRPVAVGAEKREASMRAPDIILRAPKVTEEAPAAGATAAARAVTRVRRARATGALATMGAEEVIAAIFFRVTSRNKSEPDDPGKYAFLPSFSFAAGFLVETSWMSAPNDVFFTQTKCVVPILLFFSRATVHEDKKIHKVSGRSPKLA